MKEFITACPRNCYSTCSFRVQVENNRIRRILPYTLNRATPEGPCIKGQSYVERASSPDRIIHPLVKLADGSFSVIKMESALELVADRLLEIRKKYGPQSVLWYKGSGNSGMLNDTGYSFWKNFGGATTTYGNLCWPAGLEAVRLTLGENKHNVPWDLENASAIVIWGKNPAETNIQEMAFIEKARLKGATIVVIDPRRTPTADKAQIHYAIRPGTDAALALACAKILVDENLIDKSFINEHVAGFERFCNESLTDLNDAAVICGIPQEAIRNLALLICRNKPVTFLPGYGLQRYVNGGQTIRAVLTLAIITGNLGKQGAGFSYANLQSYVWEKVKEPVSYYPDSSADKLFRRTVSMAKLGSDILKQTDPPVKAIWVERGNPMLQAPDTNSVAEAFSRSAFTVVVEQFMTDTAKAADLILPAKDIFEQPDITGSYWSPYVQFKPAVLEPSGEVTPESEIYYRLARLMSLDISENEIPAPGKANAEKWLSDRLLQYGIDLEELKKGPMLAPGLQEIAYEDFKFNTPSGKIELYPSELEKRWGVKTGISYIPDDFHRETPEFPLILITPNRASRIHSQFGNLSCIKSVVPEPALEISQADAVTRGLNTGDAVTVRGKAGKITTRIRITGRVPEGTVVLHNGIWMDEGGGGNILTEALETDIGFGAAFHGNRVEVTKYMNG